MIQLNAEQQVAVDQQAEPIEVIDPRNQVHYRLIGAETLDQLREPKSRLVRVAGRLHFDPVLVEDGAFTLVLDGGHSIVGLAKGIDPADLVKLDGHLIVFSGRAFFAPSDELLRV